MKPKISNSLFSMIAFLTLLVSLIPGTNNISARPLTAPPPVDMFQLPWEQGLSWVSFDGFDNGTRRSSNSPHNYNMGGAVDFAPHNNMMVGEDTSNFWVTAAAAGTVTTRTSCYVIINHGNGWTTEYWHLANLQVVLGQQVSRNQRLGVIADNISQPVCTGNDHPGPHLHFVMLPQMKDTIFAGWKINFNASTNITTFTKNGQTVGRNVPLLNVPNLQIVLREPIVWDTLYTGSVDAYRYEKWPLTLTEQTTFDITVNPTLGLIPVIVLLRANGTEVTRSTTGTLATTQPTGLYFVQIQSQAGTGFYTLIAHREGGSSTPAATPTGGTPTPTGTLVATNTATITNTPVASDTPLFTNTPTPTGTLAFTDTPTLTNTPVFSDTPVFTNTPIPTDTPLITDTPVVTNTSSPTETAVFTNTPTLTNTPINTDTPTPTSTPVFTDTPVFTNTPISSDTPVPTVTDTPVFTNTPITPIASDTPVFTNTPLVTDTPIFTETSTPTATATSIFTSTPTVTPTIITGPYVQTSANPLNINIGGVSLITVSLNNIPVDGYTSTEFTCTYNQNLVSVSNIAVAGLFGLDPASGILGPQNGSFIIGIAGSNGNRAMGNGTAFTFNVTGLQAGQTPVECTARVSNGQNNLQSILSIPTTVTIGSIATSTPIPTSGTVTGQVLASKPVTVTLYNPDTSVAGTVVANPDGTFSLNVPAGTYTIVATASGFLNAQGSVTVVNGNTSTKPVVSLLAGDINSDNVIDQIDVLTIGINYNNSTPTAADLNNDGVINVLDLGILAQNYLQSGALAW